MTISLCFNFCSPYSAGRFVCIALSFVFVIKSRFLLLIAVYLTFELEWVVCRCFIFKSSRSSHAQTSTIQAVLTTGFHRPCHTELSLQQATTNNENSLFWRVWGTTTTKIEPNTYLSFSYPESQVGYPGELAFCNMGWMAEFQMWCYWLLLDHSSVMWSSLFPLLGSDERAAFSLHAAASKHCDWNPKLLASVCELGSDLLSCCRTNSPLVPLLSLVPWALRGFSFSVYFLHQRSI